MLLPCAHVRRTVLNVPKLWNSMSANPSTLIESFNFQCSFSRLYQSLHLCADFFPLPLCYHDIWVNVSLSCCCVFCVAGWSSREMLSTRSTQRTLWSEDPGQVSEPEVRNQLENPGWHFCFQFCKICLSGNKLCLFCRFEIEIEPIFGSLALYDVKEKKKVFCVFVCLFSNYFSFTILTLST